MNSISIIGAGHVGCALAFDMTSRGYDVVLRSMPGHFGALHRLQENNNILESSGVLEGQVPITVDEGFRDAGSTPDDVIIVAIPSQGHDDVLKLLSQRDLSKAIVVFITGNAAGIKAKQVLNAKAVLDTATSPYSSRVNADGVIIRGIKKRLQIGPSADQLTADDRLDLEDLFNVPLHWRPTTLDIFFSGVNGVVHVPTALLNLGWIETTNGDFYFYREGMSSGVCSIIEAADKERLAVAAAYDCHATSALELYNSNYGRQEKTFRDFANNTDAHNYSKGAQKRFLSQDVPYWLVLCADLGAKASVATPVINMLISLAETISCTDYRCNGRTLKSLGLDGASASEIMEVCQES